MKVKLFRIVLVSFTLFAGVFLGSKNLSAQPVFDLPVTDFELPNIDQGFFDFSVSNTLQVGELDTSIVNPITGDSLNDVVFVYNPIFPPIPAPAGEQQMIRFFTVYHTSAIDTRQLMLSVPADLAYPIMDDHIPFFASTSAQILDLNGDGQNDVAFNGPTPSKCNPWSCGPSPILGVLGMGTDPLVGGMVDMIGRTLNFYSFPLPSVHPFLFGRYGGQPSLASADVSGDGNLDLIINDWDLDNISSEDQLGGAGGPGNAGQMLSSFINNGSFGSLLPAIDTLVNIPAPLGNTGNAIPHFIVVADFDMNGTDDSAVVYVVETSFQNQWVIRLMVYPGNGDGTFAMDPTISLDLADIGTSIFQGVPTGLTYGDFDGNGHLDFAVSYILDVDEFLSLSESSTAIVTCTPGAPPTCNVQQNTFPNELAVMNLDSGDFDGDGLDDLVQLEVLCTEFDLNNGSFCLSSQGQASTYLSQSGAFSNTPDQVIVPSTSAGFDFLPMQVIARDIDGCSPEDIAFTGTEVQANLAQGLTIGNSRGIVAFASAGNPVADAGEGIIVPGGIQLGGNPTCFDTNGNPFTIQWTQLSGPSVVISDPTAPNPIVGNITEESTFQVTCQTACGIASDTVTIGENIIEGSGFLPCSLQAGAVKAPPRLLWSLLFLSLGVVGTQMALRRRARG